MYGGCEGKKENQWRKERREVEERGGKGTGEVGLMEKDD